MMNKAIRWKILYYGIFIILCLLFSFYSKPIFGGTIEYQGDKSCSKGRDLSNVVVAGGSVQETIYYLGHPK